MAKVALNPILENIQGQVGDLVFRRFGDGVVISRKSDNSQYPPTAAQLATRERFRDGAQYGKLVMGDAALKPVYAAVARTRKKPIFSVVVADYLHAPTVSALNLEGYSGAVGDVITVSAYDDFEVTDVLVSVADAGGVVLESGAAVVSNGRWAYSTTTTVTPGTTVTVLATALDRPGNMGTAEATKLIG